METGKRKAEPRDFVEKGAHLATPARDPSLNNTAQRKIRFYWFMLSSNLA
jgi:hypothetical protein